VVIIVDGVFKLLVYSVIDMGRVAGSAVELKFLMQQHLECTASGWLWTGSISKNL